MYKWIPSKISAIMCIFTLAAGITAVPGEAAVSADSAPTNINIVINDKPLVFAINDQGPVIIEDRTYVPFRIIGESLGAKVDWIPAARQVIINKTGSQSALSIPAAPVGEVQIIIDGQLLMIPADLGKAYISKKDRTMIPVRAVAEALGCEVNWKNGTVAIKNTIPATVLPETNPVPVNNAGVTEPVQQPIPTTTTQPAPVETKPVVNVADSQLLKDLAQYRTNLKLKDGSVINSEVLSTKDPASFSSEQLVAFKTYREQLSKYQPSLTLPSGEQLNTADITILGNSILTAEQLKKWINSETPRLTTKATSLGLAFKPIPDLADLYIKIGAEYGIRGDLAFCQAAKETGYWQFTGDVKPEQNNYCGLYATGNALTGQEAMNGADAYQVFLIAGTHGATFMTPAAGVEAHIQHLYAYATKNPLPVGKTLVDPRFSLVNKGIAPSWQNLNARWAVPGTTYGQSIIYDYWFKAATTK